jgi:hypothetical protein
MRMTPVRPGLAPVLAALIAVAGLLITAGPAQARPDSTPLPTDFYFTAIAWTGSSVVIAGTDDTSGNLDYWYQPAGTSGWHEQTVAAGGYAANGTYNYYFDPSIAWAGNAVVITAADINGNVDFWRQPVGTGGWNTEQTVGTGSDPAIAWTGSSMVITATDNGSLDYWWQADGGSGWNTEQTVASGTGQDWYEPAIAWTGSSVVITATNSDTGGLYYWYQPAGTNGWNTEQTVASGCCYDLAKIAWTGTSVVITAIDAAGDLDYWYQAAGTSGWNTRQTVATGPAWYEPVIAWTGSSVVIAAVNGDNGSLYYWYQPAGSSDWNTEQTVSAASSGDEYSVPSIAWTGSSVVISAAYLYDADQYGNVEYWYQPAGTRSWNPQPVS